VSHLDLSGFDGEITEIYHLIITEQMAARIRPAPTLYRVCGNCNAPGADVKCTCLAVYYCGLACQQAHILEHKHKCTHLLCKSIKKKGAVISQLQVQGGSDGVESVELMVLEQELARIHCKVGMLMMDSHQAARYQEAVTHSKQALHLYRKVEASRCTLRGAAARAAAGKLADKAAPEGLYGALVNLGQLYGFMRKHDDELQVYQEALEEVRGDIAHASTPQFETELSTELSRILSAMGKMLVGQYYSQITNGAKGDKGKCTEAKALLVEALSIQRALLKYGMAADTLKILAAAHGFLEMFDEARSSLKQALDLTRLCDGEESEEVATCHQRMVFVCQEQVKAIIQHLFTHKMYMLTNSMRLYHSPGSRLLVKGLQKQQQYNGIEGVVVKMDGLRMCVRLDAVDNKELMLKPENVCPLLPTAAKLQEQLQKLHDLTQERIVSSKEVHRIQIKVKGVKHVNTAIACQTLGIAYLATHQAADTGLAVSLLIQADKIRCRVGDDDQDLALSISKTLSVAKAAQARFDEGVVLSAMPCWWPPTSRHEDETQMAQLFAGLQARNGKRGSPSMSSEVMQQGLRLFGLFNVTASSCDAVSGP